MDMLKDVYKIQQKLGVKCHLVDKAVLRKMIPTLNHDITCGGILQTNGGYARHDAVVWAYANASKRLGVEILPFTEVTSIDVKNSAVRGLRTNTGEIETPIIVNAAGGHCVHIASMVGIDLPIKTYRLEMIATEPLKPFLKQYISALDHIGYMHQTARGEFIGGTEPPGFQPSMNLNCTLHNLKDMASKFVDLFPCLTGVKIMRQWSGLLPTAPDAAPVLGPVAEVEGFILNCGWTYGFMAIPAAGKYLAEFIMTGKMPDIIKPFSVERFKTGDLLLDSSLVVEAGIDVEG
jgi:sarcosine oxidase subunit beta